MLYYSLRARHVSIIWSEKKEEWQIRIGTSSIVSRHKDINMALAWGNYYSKDSGLPLRLISPTLVPCNTSVFEEDNKEDRITMA